GGPSGGGGGGRLAIDYASKTFTGTTSAIGGTGTPGGNPGTVDLHSTVSGSDLVVQAGEYHLKTGDSFRSVTLLSGAILHLDGNPTITVPLVIPAGTTVWLNVSNASQFVTLPAQVDGTLVVNAPYALPGPHIINGRLWARAALTTGPIDMRAGSTLTVDHQVDVAGDLLMTAPSTINVTAGVRLMDLRVQNRLLLPFGAVIDGNAAGLPGGNRSPFGCNGAAIDPATKLTVSGALQYGGGSFGGLGANAGANPIYGTASDMEYPGSGGGCGDWGGGGGNGGGVVRVQTRVFDAYGIVRSNGGGPTPAPAAGSWGAAGSGGAVLIKATQMNGTGLMQATGGNSPRAGGGAGRIRLEVTTYNFTGVLEANGGTGAAGQNGSTSTPVVVTTLSAPTIVSTPAAAAKINAAWNYGADGGFPTAVGTQPIAWSLASGPPSATVSSTTGAVSWTPTTLGVANFTLRATNVVGVGDQVFSVQVMEPPVVVGTGAGLTRVGDPYHYSVNDSLTVTGSNPLTYAVTLSPPGNPAMTIDATGKVTWTPTMQGTFNPCIRVSNLVGQVDHCFTVTVSANLDPPLITSTPPASVVVNQPYTYQLVATGSAPITFAFLPGASPAGSTLDPASGALTWTPTQVGSGFFCVEARGIGVNTQCWNVAVTPLPVAPQIVSSCYRLATAGQAYHYDADDTVSATGTAPITWTMTGAPQGMTLAADGKLAWTPAAAGAVSFELVAANAGGTARQPCTVTVRPVGQSGPPVILRLANGVAAVGRAYRYDAGGRVRADGDQPITFSKVSGPASLTIDPRNGFIGWVPAAAAMETITVKATNASGSDTYTFTVAVSATAGTPPVGVITGGPFSGDARLDVNVDGSMSYAGGDILSWRWDFGDGSPPVDGQTATHTYATCGGFVMRLTVTDVYGQQHTEDRQVLVSCNGVKPPGAKIVATQLPTNGQLTLSFACDCQVGSAPITGYQWLSTDGYFSDQPTDQHVFGPGGHTLQLIVVDGNGLSAIDRIFVSVPDAMGNQPPLVAIFADPPGGVPPVEIAYSADYGDIDGFVETMLWTFADATTSGEPGPKRTYSANLREKATLKVTDNRGLSSVSTLDVVIGAATFEQVPEFLSLPRKSVFAGADYTYDKDGLPAVRGTGPFSFKLLKAPTGAIVEAATGRITWKPGPELSGEQELSLEVTGKAGAATQTWKVDVVSSGGGIPPKAGCGCQSIDLGLVAFGLLAFGPLVFRRRRLS
ncbi:MAG: repeat-associated core domain protein, partial [Myxococcaceae bacterium]|nr:repeat-associated core domain protein [Myxococcaceae bacterium]